MFERLKTAGLAAAAVILSVASPALANVTMECKIAQHADNGNWIPDLVYVTQTAEGATALDGIIQHYTGGPIAVKIDTDNASRTTYSWTVRTKSTSNQTTDMNYRLTIMKADKTASMVARPGRFPQNFTARGKCKQVKG